MLNLPEGFHVYQVRTVRDEDGYITLAVLGGSERRRWYNSGAQSSLENAWEEIERLIWLDAPVPEQQQ